MRVMAVLILAVVLAAEQGPAQAPPRRFIVDSHSTTAISRTSSTPWPGLTALATRWRASSPPSGTSKR
jgi:hypothetical protein